MERVLVYGRAGSALFELEPSEVYSIVRHEEVNGEHSLTIDTTRELEIGQRILTCDARGKWREHVVYGIDAVHERPVAHAAYYCVWSLQADLMGTHVSAMPGVQTPVSASTALASVVSGTDRWSVGTVTNGNTGGASMYDTDGWTAMATFVQTWGGEIDAAITVDSKTGVTARAVDNRPAIGEQDAKRRYDFGADVASVRRTIADGPLYCRISPRGMGELNDDGTYGRRVTIESVNGGLDYLENASMVDAAKLPDGSGGWEYPTLMVYNDECETPAELLAWAQTVLDEMTTPQVTYEVDVAQLAREGIDMQGVSLGDAVQVVDRKFFGGVRLSGRVLSMDVDGLSGRATHLTIGRIPEGFSDLLNGMQERMTAVETAVGAIASGTSAYIENLLDRINAEINATGGYTYITEGNGIRTYDHAVSDPLVGAEASAVVEIKGGTIRIANTKTAQGEWVWKTVFTSGHVAADVVTAANITTGYVGSSGGTFIDLDNDIIQLGDQSNVWTNITNSAFDIREGSSTIMAHFGYGSGSAQSGTANAPYYTLGTRASGTVGNWSVAEGNNTTASGYLSHAEGNGTVASGSYSHAEGEAFTSGYPTTASGTCSHAEGASTTASGNYSHAEGVHTTASGAYAHAEGGYTTASGDYSHAEGYGDSTDQTTASGLYSHAQNNRTIAASNSQTAIGKFNVSDSANTYAFIIGNGDAATRSNALTVDWSGNVAAGNTLTLGTNTSAEENGIKIKGGGSRNQYALRVISASNGDGDAVLLGDGGLTIIGAGEAAPSLYSELGLSAGAERLYLASDNAVYLVPNCQTIANRTEYSVAAKGIETPTYSGVNYITGANGSAALYVKKASGSNYYPAVCLDTTSGGSWSIGNYNNENLQFVWASQANRSSSTNTVTAVNLPNTAGTISLQPVYYSASSATQVNVTDTSKFRFLVILFRTNSTTYTGNGTSADSSPLNSTMVHINNKSSGNVYASLIGGHQVSTTMVQFRMGIATVACSTTAGKVTLSKQMYCNIDSSTQAVASNTDMALVGVVGIY